MHGEKVNFRRIVFSAFAIASVALGVKILAIIWDVRPDGSSFATQKLPVFDFMNLWAGGRLASEGMIETLFHRDAYNDWLHATFGPNIGGAEWSYPPTMLLLGAPLSYLPINVAYVVWTLGTLAGLYFACRALGASRLAALAASITPAAFVSIWFGQNGALTGSLLIGGLALVERRPWLAGVLLGLLALKPQTALLVPFAVVAAGAWRVVAAGSLTAIATAALATLAFSPDAWRLFFTETQPMMRAILEAPWPKPYQVNCATIFMLMRLLGADLTTSYAIQGVAALCCAGTCVYVWRRLDLDLASKVMITVSLAPLVSPYGYVYDLVGFQAVLIIACIRRDLQCVYLVGPILFWAMLQTQYYVWCLVGPIASLSVLAGAALMSWWTFGRGKAPAGGAASTPKISTAIA